tara:strand:- start:607 stop:1053 length:447 start_codon:yes stop_codon:yes gene_type:complete
MKNFLLLFIIPFFAFSQNITSNCTLSIEQGWMQKKDYLNIDYTQPANGYVKAVFKFTNHYKSTIVGIEYSYIFKDVFGEILARGTGKELEKIMPGQSNKINTYTYWADNPYIKNEIYDKFWPSVNGGNTIKIIVINKIAFENGEILRF